MTRALWVLVALTVGAAAGCGRGHPLTSTGHAGAGGGGGNGASGTGGERDAAPAGDDGGGTGGRNSATKADGHCVTNAFAHDGVCACQPQTPDVCGETCLSLQTDDANCGACGHACPLASTCQQGQCGPIPTSVVPAQAGCKGLHLAADGFRFYWTDTGARKVFAMNEGAGAPLTLAEQLVAPTLIATGGGKVAWFDEGKKAVEVSLGPDLIGVPAQVPAIRGLAVSDDGTTIFYSLGNSVFGVPISGGTPTTLVTEKTGQPRALATEGDLVVFTEDLTGFVLALTLVPGQMADCDSQDAQGNPIRVNCLRAAQGQGSLFHEAISLRGGIAVYADGIAVKTYRASDGKELTNTYLADVPGPNVTGVAANEAFAYFTDGNVIYKASLTDGATVRLARDQKGARSLAVTALRVLWTTDDCAINAAPL